MGKFDIKSLNNFATENNFELIGQYEKVNRESIIKGKCKTEDCCNEFKKSFRNMILYNSFFCDICLNKIVNNNKINTCLEKYGCEHQTKNKNVIDKMKKTNFEKYGCEYPLQNKEIKEKVKKTNLTRYGYEFHLHNEDIKDKRNKTYFEKFGGHPSKNDDVKNKIKKTNLQNCGFTSNLSSQETKEKIKQTNLDKYGVENIFQSQEFQEKIKQTNLLKYDVEYPMQSQETKEKSRQTCLKKYGVEHHSQSEEIMNNISNKAYKLKTYTFPSGRIDKIQGFENFGLDFLLNNENLNEDEIKTGCKNVPTIWYNDDSGKKHRHYVDIFIPSQKRCIEIKSTWTAKKKQDSIYLKQNAAKELGYKYEIWVYDRKGNRVEEYL